MSTSLTRFSHFRLYSIAIPTECPHLDHSYTRSPDLPITGAMALNVTPPSFFVDLRLNVNFTPKTLVRNKAKNLTPSVFPQISVLPLGVGPSALAYDHYSIISTHDYLVNMWYQWYNVTVLKVDGSNSDCLLIALSAACALANFSSPIQPTTLPSDLTALLQQASISEVTLTTLAHHPQLRHVVGDQSFPIGHVAHDEWLASAKLSLANLLKNELAPDDTKGPISIIVLAMSGIQHKCYGLPRSP